MGAPEPEGLVPPLEAEAAVEVARRQVGGVVLHRRRLHAQASQLPKAVEQQRPAQAAAPEATVRPDRLEVADLVQLVQPGDGERRDLAAGATTSSSRSGW
jgi:hypothetical protein